METEYLEPLVSVKRSVSPCNVCQENEEDGAYGRVAPASAHCVECHENLCDECSWHHKRQKLSRLHTVVSLSTDSKYTNFRSSVCDKHGKVQRMYCVKCKLSICMACFDERHQLHKCTMINKAAEDFKYRIKSELEKVAESCASDANMKRRLEQNERDFIEESKILQDEIFRRGAELRDLVDQHTDNLSKELIFISEKRLKQMKEAKDDFDSHLVMIEKFKLSCNEILDNGSAGEICKAADYIIDQADQIKGWSESHSFTENIPQSRLSLKESHIEDFLSLNNVVGTITGITYSAIRLNAKLNIGQRPACGVTKRQNKIYVLCHSPSSILIFQNDEPFLLQTELKTDAIRKPCDIIASEKSKSLFISDSENECVWRMGEDLRVISWLTGIGDPFTLSLTMDDRLITVRKGQPATLELYGPHVSSIQKIVQMSHCIANPCHAVEVSIGHFLVCCGGWNSKTSQLYELNDYGKIVRQFNCGVASEMCIPRHLSADLDGRVFVADSWGSRVLLVDIVSESGTAVLKESREGVMSPWRLCFDSEKRHLIVVHGNRKSGTVGVYSLDPA